MKQLEIDNLITVGICELSDELATREIFNYYKLHNSGKSEDEIEDMIYVEDEDEKNCFIFRDEAQDMFNDLYNEYYTLIEKLAL
jgi:hypothetical protein